MRGGKAGLTGERVRRASEHVHGAPVLRNKLVEHALLALDDRRDSRELAEARGVVAVAALWASAHARVSGSGRGGRGRRRTEITAVALLHSVEHCGGHRVSGKESAGAEEGCGVDDTHGLEDGVVGLEEPSNGNVLWEASNRDAEGRDCKRKRKKRMAD